jgi:hypothetical protein
MPKVFSPGAEKITWWISFELGAKGCRPGTVVFLRQIPLTVWSHQTDTVLVDISYNGRPPFVAGLDVSPIRLAASGSGRTLVASVATLISFLAAALPWLPLIPFVIWFARRMRVRWKARKAQV